MQQKGKQNLKISRSGIGFELCPSYSTSKLYQFIPTQCLVKMGRLLGRAQDPPHDLPPTAKKCHPWPFQASDSMLGP